MTRTMPASHPPRLLYVANQARFFVTHRLPLALAAARLGYEVHVAAPRAAECSVLTANGLIWHEWDVSRSGLFEIGSVTRLAGLFRRVRPMVSHHVALKAVLYGTVAARLAETPCVVNAVTGLGYVFVAESAKAKVIRSIYSSVARLCLPHPNAAFVFQNPDDLQLFENLRLLGRAQRHLIRGSGADPAIFRPLPEPPGPPVVVFPARMLWSKGLGDFIEAARIARAEGLPARFVLVGEPDVGNPDSAKMAEIEEWARSGIAEWWGYRGDMPAVFAQAHVVVLPSRREGVPKVLIEAAACAKPIVTTDAPGCREIVRDGWNGYLVPVGDSTALARVIRRLVEAPALRAQLGATGRAYVEQEFTTERVVAQTLSVYEELLASCGEGVSRREPESSGR